MQALTECRASAEEAFQHIKYALLEFYIKISCKIFSYDFSLFRYLVVLLIFHLSAYIALNTSYMLVFHSSVLVIIACSSEIKYPNGKNCLTGFNSPLSCKLNEKLSPRGKR